MLGLEIGVVLSSFKCRSLLTSTNDDVVPLDLVDELSHFLLGVKIIDVGQPKVDLDDAAVQVSMAVTLLLAHMKLVLDQFPNGKSQTKLVLELVELFGQLVNDEREVSSLDVLGVELAHIVLLHVVDHIEPQDDCEDYHQIRYD